MKLVLNLEYMEILNTTKLLEVSNQPYNLNEQYDSL